MGFRDAYSAAGALGKKVTKANSAKKGLLPEESGLTEVNLDSCVDIGFAEKMKKLERAEGTPVWQGLLGGEFMGVVFGERATQNVWMESDGGKSVRSGRSLELFVFLPWNRIAYPTFLP